VAAVWFEKAANAGNVQAQRRLADLYTEGGVFPRDLDRAAALYRAAAEQGDAESQLAYAEFLSSRSSNSKEALQWYRRAAERGNAWAQLKLGDVYLKGLGVPVDAEKAIRLYLASAKSGNLHAMTALGDMYAAGVGVPQDLAEAAKWYSRAAKAEDQNAENSQ
jgi:TPR repeat protein